MYCPVKIEALLGEHRDVLTNAFFMWAPSEASLSIVGVSSHSGESGWNPIKWDGYFDALGDWRLGKSNLL